MADQKEPGSNKKTFLILGAIVAVLIVLGLAQFMAQESAQKTIDEQAAQLEQSGAPEEQQTSTGETSAATSATAPVVDADAVTIDVEAALSDRVLGDVNAPVKMSEHVSFTCSHCAAFYKDTFDKLKKEYVDTDKVYILFSDFPLNAPAMHASMIARCLPHEKYFDFVHTLFIEQEKWAYDTGYLNFLKAKAAENGLDEAHFQACIQNTELQNGLVEKMQSAQSQWQIASTPSFVFNNKTVLNGAVPLEEFEKTINAEIEKAKSEGSAPATATTPAPATEEKVEEKKEVAPATVTKDAPAEKIEAAPESEESEVTPEPDEVPVDDATTSPEEKAPAE